MEDERLGFNGMNAKEWAASSTSVLRGFSSPRTRFQQKHGATFPQDLIEYLIKIYSAKNDLVLDVFAGTGITILACKATRRRGIGIELNKEFFKGADADIKMNLDIHLIDDARLKWQMINDDCRNVLQYIKENSCQLMITSPPYANFIRKSELDREKIHKNSLFVAENNSMVKSYSTDDKDFGNLDYPGFLEETEGLMRKLYLITKPGGYNVWIVKDSRDTKAGIPYISLHSDLAEIGKSAGFKSHDLLIWDQSGNRKNVVLGFPSIFYTNQNCSFIVILRKC